MIEKVEQYSQGAREREQREVIRYRVSIGNDENVLEMDGRSWLHKIVYVFNATELST